MSIVPDARGLTAQLSALAQLVDANRPRVVRVRTRDGRTIEGLLNGASPEHVSVLGDSIGAVTQVWSEEIVTLDVARQHPLVVPIAVAGAAMFVGIGVALQLRGVPVVLAWLGIGAAAVVVMPPLRRLAKGLRRWVRLYGDGTA